MGGGRARERGAEPAPLPNFRACAADPQLPDRQAGVRIAADDVEIATGYRRWQLHGTFRVPRELAGAHPEAVLQRIVITLRNGSTHDIQARPALLDELVFADDVEERGDQIAGAFHLDLLACFGFVAARDTYFITASIAEHVSDVLCRDVRMPWLVEGPVDAPDEGEPEDDEDAEELASDDEDDDGWMVDDPA